jgi:hypothetical protein
MIKRAAATFAMGVVLAVPAMLATAGPGYADAPPPPPPLFDIPVEVLPFIHVPPPLGTVVPEIGNNVIDGVVDYNRANPAQVQGGFGLLAGILCPIATLLGNHC